LEYIKDLYDSYFPKMNTELLWWIMIIAMVTGAVGYLILKIIADRMASTKAVGCAILSVYYYIILLSTVYTRVYREPESKLELFWTYRVAFAGDMKRTEYLILNILLFVPIGFGIGFILNRIIKWKCIVVLLISIFASVVIEVQQYRLGRGLCEFDDVFNNSLGGLLGFWLFCIGKWLFGKIRRIRHKGDRVGE